MQENPHLEPHISFISLMHAAMAFLSNLEMGGGGGGWRRWPGDIFMYKELLEVDENVRLRWGF